MLMRLAIRNIRRNRWRSLITALGIALAIAMLVWTNAFIETMMSDMVRAATAVETGQVQVRTAAYDERPSIYDSFAVDDALITEVSGLSGVAGAAPRTYAFGLIGNEQKSLVGRTVGVLPDAEAVASMVDDGLTEGRWLASAPAEIPGPREAVVGYQLAQQLNVGVGDELVVFLEAADGSLGNDLLTIVGITRTGNSMVDRTSVYMHRDDLAYTAALEGVAHEVIITVDNLDDVDAVAGRVRTVLQSHMADAGALEPDDTPVVRTWEQTMSQLYNMISVQESSSWLLYILVYGVAGLGLLNTQRMGALERRREFGVLMAVGMHPSRIGRMIIVETVALTAAGAFLGVLLGGAVTLYHGAVGLRMVAEGAGSGSFSFMGVAFAERMYLHLSASTIVEPFLAVLVVALVCGIFPAWGAMRIDPIRAIAGRS